MLMKLTSGYLAIKYLSNHIHVNCKVKEKNRLKQKSFNQFLSTQDTSKLQVIKRFEELKMSTKLNDDEFDGKAIKVLEDSFINLFNSNNCFFFAFFIMF